jgi:hypothetical protein
MTYPDATVQRGLFEELGLKGVENEDYYTRLRNMCSVFKAKQLLGID